MQGRNIPRMGHLSITGHHILHKHIPTLIHNYRQFSAVMLLGAGRKSENPGKHTWTQGEHVKPHTESNISSGSNYGSWSFETVVLFLIFHI